MPCERAAFERAPFGTNTATSTAVQCAVISWLMLVVQDKIITTSLLQRATGVLRDRTSPLRLPHAVRAHHARARIRRDEHRDRLGGPIRRHQLLDAGGATRTGRPRFFGR